MTRAVRMNTQSILGTLMLQWLTEIVCPIDPFKCLPPEIRGKSLTESLLEAAATTGAHVTVVGTPEPAMTRCTCCDRMVKMRDIDWMYTVCGDCALCLSLGNCFDPAVGYVKHGCVCCHGENHR